MSEDHEEIRRFWGNGNFLYSLRRNSRFRTWFCNCPQYLWLFHIFFECIPSMHDLRKMLVLPNRLLSWVVSTSEKDFVFPVSFMASTYTDKTNPFSRWTKRHSQFGIFSQPCFNKIFSNCLSHKRPAKGWPYRFRSRRTTGSSILDQGHLCRGRRIQMSGHSDFGVFNNLRASSIFLGYTPDYCVCCLSIATRQSGDDIHDLSCCHLRCWRSLFSEYCIRTRVVCGEQLDLCIFGALPPIQHFQMTDVHWWCKMNCSARRPCIIDHLFLTPDFRQDQRRNFLQFFSFLVHRCFCCSNF